MLVIINTTLFSILILSKPSGGLFEPSAFIPHNVILINGDSGFTKGNGVVGGNGTKDQPYLIENWIFDQNKVDHGISVKNTEKYFIIRNCKIYNGTSVKVQTYGIYLQNVRNGTIENNRITSNYYGIYLVQSEIITISNNICNYSQDAGIFLEFSDQNTIVTNTCKDNCNGIVLEHSSQNTIKSNTLFDNDEGICVIDSKSNTIRDNTPKNNTYDGIFIFNSHSNEITNNSCEFNGRNGVHLWYSDDNSVTVNVGSSSGYQGICLRESNANFIRRNKCTSSFYDGIGIDESENNIITDNICNSNNNNGIVMYDSKSNTIFNNSCKLNSNDGISIVRFTEVSDNNIICSNICKSNAKNGISCLGGEENSIMDSICELNNKNGIYINGNSNHILNNFCKSNQIGILLYESNDNTLRENTMVLCGIMINGKSLMNWNSHYIDTTNSVNAKPVYYWKNKSNGTVPNYAGQVILANCSGIGICEQDLSFGSVGILLGFATDAVISATRCSNNNLDGIHFYSSPGNIIDNCSIYSNLNYDFYFHSNSKNNIAINSTFNTIFFVETSSELIIKNYLNVQVNSMNNKPKQGVDLLIKDNNRIIYATPRFGRNNPQTNHLGQVTWIIITDRIYPGENSATENITQIKTWYDDIPILNHSRKVDMSTSHFEYFYLDNFLPSKIDLKNPVNNSITNDSRPELSWFSGYDRNYDPITYNLQVSEFGNNWTFSISKNHISQEILSEKFTKPLKDGRYQWRVRANDDYGAGSWSEVWNFKIDTTPPTSKIVTPIDNGIYNKLANICGTAQDLFKGSGVKGVEICIKSLNDDLFWNGSNWTSVEVWVPTMNTKVWSYDTTSIEWITDNYYNIRSRANDNAGNYEIPYAGIYFLYDDKPPVSAIVINNNLKYTNSTHVVLSLTAEDSGSGVANVAYSIDEIVWSTKEQFNYTRDFELPKGDGIKSVFYKVEDRAKNYAISYDEIILDTTPPTSLAVKINKGAGKTSSTKVTLNLLAIDTLSGVSHMSFSSDGENWSSWVEYSTKKSYTLNPGDGEKLVYFMVKDWAGNIAEPVRTSIILNTTILKTEEPPPENEITEKSIGLLYYIYVLIFIIIVILIFILLAGRRKRRGKEKSKHVDNKDLQN